MKAIILSLGLTVTFFACEASAGPAKVIDAGLNLFDHGCTSCHDDSGYMVTGDGPALFGVVGRRVGSVAGFTYSPALRAAYQNGDIWTQERLETFLANPGHMYPGTTMPWSFSERADRNAMVAYLKSLRAWKAKP